MKYTIALSLFLFSVTAISSASDMSDFERRLYSKYPPTIGAKIEKSFLDFWSVVKNGEVFFINDDLSLLITGEVFDIRNNKSLTKDLLKVDIEWPMNDAIRFGTGERKLYVFSDPDCGFCRKLQSEIDKLTNASVYVFMMPISNIHPSALTVSESIWCSKDRASAWSDYMNKGVTPSPAKCDNPIERNTELAGIIGVKGTPTIFFEDGTMASGSLTKEQLNSRMEVAKQ